MAYYKNGNYLTKTDHVLFGKLFEPGAVTPYSGVYRCEVCGNWRLVVGHQPDPNK
jgi:hypothetical protein